MSENNTTEEKKEEQTTAAQPQSTPEGSTTSAPDPTPQPGSEVKTEEKTMEVPVSKLDQLFQELDALRKDREEDKKTINALEKTVSETRLAEARASADSDKRQRVHFKKLDGKVVIGWPETVGEDKINEWVFSPSNPTAPIGEILKCRFYFLDGSKSELIDQVRLTRSNEQAFARVVEDLGDFAMVKFEDESILKDPIKIHKRFFNA